MDNNIKPELIKYIFLKTSFNKTKLSVEVMTPNYIIQKNNYISIVFKLVIKKCIHNHTFLF